MPTVLRGLTAVREVYNSGELSSQAGEKRQIKRYRGLYDDLVAEEPAVGTLMAGDDLYSVESAATVRLKGNIGETTITYVRYVNLESISPTSTLKVEIDWIREEVPFTAMLYVAGHDMQDVIARIDDYLNERNATTRGDIRTEIEGWGDAPKRLLALRLAGVTSYPISRPVVRKSEELLLRPSTIGANINKRQSPTGIGTVSYPTSYAGPGGESETWTYVKMVDRASRTGRNKKWERQEEWQGFYLPSTMQTDVKAAVLSMYPEAT
jgi:hypothetical protein